MDRPEFTPSEHRAVVSTLIGQLTQRMGDILEAIQILAHSPQTGQPMKDGTRELVIGRATRGYVELYRYVAAIDTVFVLAIRAQREAGF